MAAKRSMVLCFFIIRSSNSLKKYRPQRNYGYVFLGFNWKRGPKILGIPDVFFIVFSKHTVANRSLNPCEGDALKKIHPDNQLFKIKIAVF
jgi:hypothetical protein